MRNTILYFVVKQGDKEFRCETRAAAYEMWDCLKRKDVIVEWHYIDYDLGKHYIQTATRPRRRMLKSGQMKYYFSWANERVIPA